MIFGMFRTGKIVLDEVHYSNEHESKKKEIQYVDARDMNFTVNFKCTLSVTHFKPADAGFSGGTFDPHSRNLRLS